MLNLVRILSKKLFESSWEMKKGSLHSRVWLTKKLRVEAEEMLLIPGNYK
jgi:hypothetical protein